MFGGSTNKQVGRRTQAGKVFNRRNQPNVAAKKAGFYGAGGADLGLNEGVIPEGNLWHTWTPDAPGSQYGTLSTGASGYYSPTTGKFIFQDFNSTDDGTFVDDSYTGD